MRSAKSDTASGLPDGSDGASWWPGVLIATTSRDPVSMGSRGLNSRQDEAPPCRRTMGRSPATSGPIRPEVPGQGPPLLPQLALGGEGDHARAGVRVRDLPA